VALLTSKPEHFWSNINRIKTFGTLWDHVVLGPSGFYAFRDKTSSILPPQEREKETSVREELAKQQKGIHFLTPGSDLWQKVREEITRLEGLLAQGGGRIACPEALQDSKGSPAA
jgi:hypothetical protein